MVTRLLKLVWVGLLGAGLSFGQGAGAIKTQEIASSTGKVTVYGLADHAGQVFNVKAYGTKGDGTTNDTTAIQAAETAANSSGGVVYFPPGTYLITGGLTVTGNNVAIACANGATIKAGNVQMVTVSGDSDSIEGCGFLHTAGTTGEAIHSTAATNLKIFRNIITTAGGGGYVVHIAGGSNVEIYSNNFNINQTAGIGVTDAALRVNVHDNVLDGSTNGSSDSVISVASLQSDSDYCRHITFSHNKIHNVLIGLQANGVDDLLITGNDVDGTTQDGIQVEQAASYSTRANVNVVVSQNTVQNANNFNRVSIFAAIHVDASTVGFFNQGVQIVNNKIITPYWDGIYVVSNFDLLIQGNVFEGPNTAGNCIEGSADVRTAVNENVCDSVYQSGIDFSAAGNSQVSANGNTLNDVNRANASYKAIVLAGSGCIAEGNTLTYGANPAGRDIDTSGCTNGTDIIIGNNLPTGGTSGGLALTANGQYWANNTFYHNGFLYGPASFGSIPSPGAIGGTTPALGTFTTLTSTKAVNSAVNTVTFSATPTFDVSLGNTQEITLTANVTSSTLTNAVAGEKLNFIICQDVTGSRAFVWPTQMHGAMIIGSTASKCSAQSFIFNGTSAFALSSGIVNQ